jgi:uncharacterized protein YceH (UPF0502 family)
MITLTPDEARVLGVLIEKSLTTPNQYPLSLNAVVDGANQKSNRDPVLNMTEDQAFDALESLRGKQLVVRVDQLGARVHKFKHAAVEVLHARTAEVAILAELMLRGPQTLGELRGRASRMQPMESLERVRDMIRALSERPEPYVKEIPPSPGSRAERFVQLLSPDLHPLDAAPMPAAALAGAPIVQSDLAERVERLEADVESLKSVVRKLAQSLGEPDPLEQAQAQ